MDSGCTRRELLGTIGTVAAGAAVADSASAQQITEEWPTFGYDRTHTGHNPNGTGLTENPGGAWQYLDAGGAYRASVAVADGTVYAANVDRHCHAVDAASGEPLENWPVALGAPSEAPPTVADGTVYIGNEKGTLRALDGSSGETQWRFDTEGPIRSAPVVHDGVVYATSLDGVVYAIDAETGAETGAETLWEFDTSEATAADVELRGAPSVVATGDGVTVYVANTGGFVYAIDGNGEQLWEQLVDSGQIQSTPVVANGSVYVTAIQSAAGFAYALDAGSGRQEWAFEANGAFIAAPAATSEQVYIGSRDGNLYALDVDSGDEQWRFNTGRYINSSPAVVDGTVYTANFGNEVFGLTTDGDERWRIETSGTISGSPAVAGGQVYLGSENSGLYALESGGDVSFTSGVQREDPVENSPLANPDSSPFAFLFLPAVVVSFVGLFAGGLYLLFNSEWAERFNVDEAPIEKLYEDEEDGPEMPGFGERNETEVWSVIVNDVISRAENSQTVAREDIIVKKYIDDALESPVIAYEIESARDEPAQVTIEEELGEHGPAAFEDQPLNEGWRLTDQLAFRTTVEPGKTIKTMVGRPDTPDDEFEDLLDRPDVTIEITEDKDATAVSDGSGENGENE